MKDTDAINLYKNMRETLGIVYLPANIPFDPLYCVPLRY